MKILKRLKKAIKGGPFNTDPILQEIISELQRDTQEQIREYQEACIEAKEVIEALQGQVKDLQFSLEQARMSSSFNKEFQGVDRDVINSLLATIKELEAESKGSKDAAVCATYCHEYDKMAWKRHIRALQEKLSEQ